MKLRALVVDDEPIALEKLKKYVEKVPFLELAGMCHNGLEATTLVTTEKIDVVFIDINMPDMNGLEFVETLTAPPLIVFITAYTDYAVESYKYSAVDYLLKPYGFADFQRAANKVLYQYKLRTEAKKLQSDNGGADGSLFIKTDYRYVRVKVADISYIKGYGEYLKIYVAQGGSPLLTLSSFNSISEGLPIDFRQVHRSYVVNMNRVKSVNKGRITMGDGTEIPVGDSYKASLQEYLTKHSVGSRKKQDDTGNCSDIH